MAEFQEVMKQKFRMCNAHKGCNDCPIYNCKERKSSHFLCSEFVHRYPAITEEIIMKWAAENPESVYPTWAKWHCENFPGAIDSICPHMFLSKKQRDEKYICSTKGCDWCRNRPIPADIAEKLGIKPIEGGKNNA